MITIDEALDLLREHSADNLGEGESEEAIARAEAKLGIRFPDSYRRFLREVGYAEVYGDEIYSTYDDVPDDMPCLGIVQQNIKSPLLSKGFLAFLTTDIDGEFFIRIEDGTIYLRDVSNKVADSFEELIEKLLKETL